jgi:serpin B
VETRNRQGPAAAQHLDKARALAAAYNAMGRDLLAHFAAGPGNIVLSPYSIGTAMAMTLAGARGETEREMWAVLKHTLGRADVVDASRRVQVTLAGYREARLKVANALMLTREAGSSIAPEYAALLREGFAAEIFRNAGVDAVNAWVSERTEGKIARILDRLPQDAAATIVNAVHLKATWRNPFEKSATSDRDFHLSASSKVKVPTMHKVGDFAVATRPGYRAIRLAYNAEQLSMLIVVPEAVDATAALARRLDPAELASLRSQLQQPAPTALSMPLIKAHFQAGLRPAFEKLGMRLAFDPKRADFAGMTAGGTRVVIGDITHVALIDVDEEGTEAAAATAVSAAVVVSAPAAPRPFHVDRPFLFYLVDDTTGAVLFQGRIGDPRGPGA